MPNNVAFRWSYDLMSTEELFDLVIEKYNLFSILDSKALDKEKLYLGNVKIAKDKALRKGSTLAIYYYLKGIMGADNLISTNSMILGRELNINHSYVKKSLRLLKEKGIIVEIPSIRKVKSIRLDPNHYYKENLEAFSRETLKNLGRDKSLRDGKTLAILTHLVYLGLTIKDSKENPISVLKIRDDLEINSSHIYKCLKLLKIKGYISLIKAPLNLGLLYKFVGEINTKVELYIKLYINGFHSKGEFILYDRMTKKGYWDALGMTLKVKNPLSGEYVLHSVDFVHKKLKLVIEVDGISHNNYNEDSLKDYTLNYNGYTVVRIKEETMKVMSVRRPVNE